MVLPALPPIPKTERRSLIAACIMCVLCGLLASAVLNRAYPTGIVFVDTLEYLQSWQTMPNARSVIIDHARPPLTGILLRLALLGPQPAMIFFWIQALLFSLNIGILCWFGTFFLRSVLKGLCFALLFLLMQILLMEAFFANLFVLSDPLYTNLLFAGTLLGIGGWMRSKRSLLIVAYCLLAMAAITRSMGVIFALWIPITLFFAYAGPYRHGRLAMMLITILLIPTVAWRVRNIIVHDAWLSNPYVARHLATLVPVLIQTGDDVFHDAALSASFVKAVQDTRIPEDHTAPDPFGRTADHPLGVIMGFYGSLTNAYAEHGVKAKDIDRIRYTFETAAISKITTWRLIRLHPTEYIHMLVRKYALQFNSLALWHYEPTRFLPYAPSVQLQNVEQLDPHLKKIFYPRDRTIFLQVDENVTGILWRISVGSSIYRHIASHPFVPFGFAHVLLFGCLFTVTKRNRMDASLLPIATACIILFLTAALHFFAMAVITDYMDARYALPGSLPLHAYFLLALCALCIGRKHNNARFPFCHS